MKTMLHTLSLCLLTSAGTAIARGQAPQETPPQIQRSQPNRPSPGLDWIEAERNMTRDERRILWLQLFDHNGNGRLDPEEIEEMARYRHAHRGIKITNQNNRYFKEVLA